MTFTSEITLDVEVEILSATRGTPARLTGPPDEREPAEPAEVELAVWLAHDDGRIDLAPYLPAELLALLESEALDHLTD